MKARPSNALHRRVETWLWTGPAGHLAGTALDLAQALVSYMRTRRAGGAQRMR
jgi:hypothetical protein